MALSFHRIAYEALDICNGVERYAVEAMLDRTGLKAGRALDIGCGNASVSIAMASRGLEVTAVEYDPAMADLARDRIDRAGVRVTLVEGAGHTMLTADGPWDLIVALGTTAPVGPDVREPVEVFRALAAALVPGGWLLWGDLTWVAEPSQPVRQIVEMSGIYRDHDGWNRDATRAGLQVVTSRLSSAETWDAYGRTMHGAAEAWLAGHPDHPDAPAVRARLEQNRMLLSFGHGALGFGLHLLRRPV